MTTERAPVAGQQTGRGGAGRTAGAGRSILEGIVDPNSRGVNPLMEQLLRSQGRSPFGGLVDPQTPGGDIGSGAAAAAGVLTAVDEDGEGDEEAGVPNAFDYFSDGEDEEDE